MAFCFGYNDKDPQGVDTLMFSKLTPVFDTSPRELLLFQHFPVLKAMVGILARIFPQAAPDGILALQRLARQRLHSSDNSGDPTKAGLFAEMKRLASMKDQTLSEEEIIAESIVMFFAGTDTTASVISVGLWHLLQRPSLYKRLQQELAPVMPDINSRPSLEELESLPLLDACVKEGLRITCPVRGRSPRIVPPGGLQVGKVFLPPGTVVSNNLSFMCFDEQIFPQPLEYRPERWLSGDTKLLDEAFYPFLRGSRQCIGQTLSLIEQRIALAQFVRRFSPPEEHPSHELRWKEYTTLVIEEDLTVQLGIAK
ncbi:hypothetical protein RBB50_010731 [Rhinocladiella similis]